MRVQLLALMAALVLLPLPLMADTVYTYTGNAFTTADAPYTTSDFLSGSFTMLAPLPPSLSSESIHPVSFSFTDGLHSFDSASGVASFFSVATDASGDITQWSIQLVSSSYIQSSETMDLAGTSSLGSSASNQGDPGVWTSQTLPPFVPEPSTFVLLGTGLFGLAGAARHRLLSHLK